MNYNNIVILENYQMLLEKALFSEYIKEANNSQTLKNKFSELDKRVPSGYKYLNSPSKEDEVEILKQISRSDMFKKAALGAGIGATAGLGSGLLLNKLKFNKSIEGKEKEDRKQKYEEQRKNFTRNAILTNGMNSLFKDYDNYDGRGRNIRSLDYGSSADVKRRDNTYHKLLADKERLESIYNSLPSNSSERNTISDRLSKVNSSIDKISKIINSDKLTTDLTKAITDNRSYVYDKEYRKNQASSVKSLKDKFNMTSKEFSNKRRNSLMGGTGIGAVAGLAAGLATAKILAKNTKHVTLAGRKVYAVISKDSKTIYNLALPYSNGSKIIVRFIKASMSSI